VSECCANENGTNTKGLVRHRQQVVAGLRKAKYEDLLPDSLLIIGGGVIGCELGRMFARAGLFRAPLQARQQHSQGKGLNLARASFSRSFKHVGKRHVVQSFSPR